MKKDNSEKYIALLDEVRRMFLLGDEDKVPKSVHSIVNNVINEVVCEAKELLNRETEECIAPYKAVAAHLKYEMVYKYEFHEDDRERALMYLTFMVMM